MTQHNYCCTNASRRVGSMLWQCLPQQWCLKCLVSYLKQKHGPQCVGYVVADYRCLQNHIVITTRTTKVDEGCQNTICGRPSLVRAYWILAFFHKNDFIGGKYFRQNSLFLPHLLLISSSFLHLKAIENPYFFVAIYTLYLSIYSSWASCWWHLWWRTHVNSTTRTSPQMSYVKCCRR